MKLHDLLKQVSAVLTPKTDSFYAFMLDAADNNLFFLRTRSCLDQLTLFIPEDSVNADVSATRKNRLKDAEVDEFNRVLVCFREKFTEGDQYYSQRTAFGQEVTDVLVSCELYLDCYDDVDIRARASSAYDDGYEYAYMVDLTNKTYSVDTLPLIKNQNLIVLELDSLGRFHYGWYYDTQGVEYDLKATINRGMLVDTVLITLHDPEIDALQSFVCRYRLRGDGGVDFYPNRHDLMVKNKSKLIVNGVEYDKNG